MPKTAKYEDDTSKLPKSVPSGMFCRNLNEDCFGDNTPADKEVVALTTQLNPEGTTGDPTEGN
jgi:hypothetical protein